MLDNQKGIIKSKVIMLSLLIIILIGGLLYVTGIYPPPESILTVGSIGGAERAERYRNAETGKIELDENEVNMFFQSAEWQNISKDPELLAIFKNKELLEMFAFAINVKQFMAVYTNLEAEAKAQNVQTQEEFNEFMNTAFDAVMWILNLPPEQAFYITNLQQNGQLEQLQKLYKSIGSFNLPENEKFDNLFKAAYFYSFRANEVDNFLQSPDNNNFNKFWSTKFSSLDNDFSIFVANFDTKMGLLVLLNSNDFMSRFFEGMRRNQEIFDFITMNQDIMDAIVFNSDIRNIVNSNIFEFIFISNQDFSNTVGGF